MMISIENEQISASFSSKGGELQSLKHKVQDLEYMWSGNPEYWGKFSPILFPVVGGLKDNTYHYKDHSYSLPRHGFARDHEFEIDRISDTEVLFSLQHSEETLKVYPFEFSLGLRYQLSGTTIKCTYEVSNPGTDPLLFSVGGHPAFALPLNKALTYHDYHLQFNKDEELVVNKISHDLIDDEIEVIPLKDGKLALKHELFYQDALVFKHLKSNVIAIRSEKDTNGLDFKFSNFPFFGIWAAKDADFICLEPWCGIADGIHHNQQLKDKEGIQTLAAHENWERSWELTVII